MVRSGITLQDSDVIRINGKLEVGSLTDSVQVTAQSARLQTSSPEVSPALEGDFNRPLGPAIGPDAAGRPVARGAIFDPATFRQVAGGRWIGDLFPRAVQQSEREYQ